ncbi:MAG: endo-1,4-beta-xylanase [Ignavibacteriales bacterium]
MHVKDTVKVDKVGSTIDAQMILIFQILENPNLSREQKVQQFNQLIAQGQVGSPEFVDLYKNSIEKELAKADTPLNEDQIKKLEGMLQDKALEDKAKERNLNPSEILIEEIRGIVTTTQLQNIINTGLKLKQRTGNGFQGFEPPTYEQAEKLYDIYKGNFNCFTPDGELMSGILSPDGSSFNFAGLDIISDYAQKNNIEMRGLSFVWHHKFPGVLEKISQDEERAGNDPSKAIQGIFREYTAQYSNKGYNCYAWDILNEIAYDDGVRTEGEEQAGYENRIFRDSKWAMAIPIEEDERTEFMSKADIALAKGEPFSERDREYLALYINLLEIARESAPNEKFYINEFHLENPQKRENFLKIIRAIRTYEQASGKTLIDGVAYQCHINTDTKLQEVENAIIGLEEINKDFPEKPLDIQISELDISHMRNEGSLEEKRKESPEIEEYTPEVKQEEDKKQANLYDGVFDIVNRHSNNMSLVSFWGPADNLSCANHIYGYGKMAHATLIDENYEVKSCVREYERNSKEERAETSPKAYFTKEDISRAAEDIDREEVPGVVRPIVLEEQKGQEQEKNVSVRSSNSVGSYVR